MRPAPIALNYSVENIRNDVTAPITLNYSVENIRNDVTPENHNNNI